MSIKVEPSKILRQLTPEAKLKRLLTKRVTVKKTALSIFDQADFIDKKKVTDVALKTAKEYQKRIKDDPDLEKKLKKNPAQLIHRVQNEVVTQITEGIREKYRGVKYKWLPSDADEPDPQHQIKYGKVFTIGVGEMPGDRYGCRCGMEILTNDKKLEL